MSAETDIKNIELNKNPVFKIFNTEVDRYTLIIFGFAILITICIRLNILGEFKTEDNIFTNILIGFFIFGIYNSSVYTSSYIIEEEELKTIEQISSILLSAIVIFVTFIPKHFMTEETYKVMFTALLLSILSLAYIPGEKTGKVKRIVRKIKTALITLVLALFIYAVYIILAHNKKMLV